MRIEHLLNLLGCIFTLVEQVSELVGEFGQDEFGCLGAGHGYGLLIQRGHDRLDEFLVRPGCAGACHAQQPPPAGGAEPVGSAESGE